MNGRLKKMAQVSGTLFVVAVAVGGWCFGLGQRTHDATVVKRVEAIEIKQATWEARWDERWERILEELKAINARLSR